MKKRILLIVSACILVIAALGLSACGSTASTTSGSQQPANTSSDSASSSDNSSSNSSSTGSQEALDKMVAAAQTTAVDTLQKNSATYSNVTITGEGDHTLVYTYTYKNALDAAKCKAALEAQAPALKSAAQTVNAALKAAGVVDPAVKFIYLNSDGSMIDTFSY